MIGSIAKAGIETEVSILDKLWRKENILEKWVSDRGMFKVFYTRKVHAFLNVLDFIPKIYDGNGNLREPSEQKTLEFNDKLFCKAVLCVLNSTLFRWFLTTFSDCRNVNRREVLKFPIELTHLVDANSKALFELADELSINLQNTSEIREMRFNNNLLKVQCIIPRFSKEIIDKIDQIMAQHYGFTQEE